MGFEVFQCVSLGPAVGELLEIADPRAIFFPVDNLGCMHAAALQVWHAMAFAKRYRSELPEQALVVADLAATDATYRQQTQTLRKGLPTIGACSKSKDAQASSDVAA